MCAHVCVCVWQTAASAKELEQYYSEAQIWLELLEEEVKQGENLKEEDFQENKVSHTHSRIMTFLLTLYASKQCVCHTGL